jgi:hypothetical protein
MFHKRNYHKQRESPGQNLNITTREKISRPHLRLAGNSKRGRVAIFPGAFIDCFN